MLQRLSMTKANCPMGSFAEHILRSACWERHNRFLQRLKWQTPFLLCTWERLSPKPKASYDQSSSVLEKNWTETIDGKTKRGWFAFLRAHMYCSHVYTDLPQTDTQTPKTGRQLWLLQRSKQAKGAAKMIYWVKICPTIEKSKVCS